MSENDDEQTEITEEEMAERFAEQLAKTPVRDIVLQSLATLIDSAGIRLGYGPVGEEGRDLAEAKQAIEAASALLDVTEREVGEEFAAPFREPVRVLKMAFVQASGGDTAPAADGSDGTAPTAETPPAESAAPDPASKLWVPPGTRPND